MNSQPDTTAPGDGATISRLIHHRDMTGDQIVDCSYDALALLRLCDMAAWQIQNVIPADQSPIVADYIGSAVRLAIELLEPVHDALESHEGKIGGAV